MNNFRTYNISVEFYRQCQTLGLPSHLRDQLLRASSSIALNLAEGSGRAHKRDKQKFFNIAFGSVRECRAILDLQTGIPAELAELEDKLAAHIYKLIQNTRGR